MMKLRYNYSSHFRLFSFAHVKCFGFVFLFANTLLVNVHAQWTGSLSLDGGYADNAFANYLTTPASHYAGSLFFGYFPESGRVGASYSGAYNTFGQYPNRNYSTHQLTFSYAIPYGNEDRNSISILTSGAIRFDGTAFTTYDYNQALASASLKHVFEDILSGRIGYRAQYRTYPNFLDLTYLDQSAFINASTSFSTKTSISAELNYGYKNYHTSITTATQNGVSSIIMNSPPFSVEDNHSGHHGNEDHNPNFQPGKGMHGVNLNTQANPGIQSTVQYLVYEVPSTSQLRASLNVAQSLGVHTGISLRYLQRWNLTNRGRAFVGGAVDFIGEEELFDDPYSYESKELTLTLTQYLPFSIKAQMAGYYFDKRYPYPNTLDYTSSAGNRTDERFGLWTSLERPIEGSWLLFDGLTVMLHYIYTRNQSNTTYYDYSSNMFTIGIETTF